MYVNVGATGRKDGTTWADAFTDLQKAITTAAGSCCREIWVAAGTYKPDLPPLNGGQRTSTFTIPSGVTIYGGTLVGSGAAGAP